MSLTANSIFEDHALPGCESSDWSSWSACSVTCGNGNRIRTRSKIVEETNGGLCRGEAVQNELCNEKECPGIKSLNPLIKHKLLSIQEIKIFQYFFSISRLQVE